jgi:hypothetical protein
MAYHLDFKEMKHMEIEHDIMQCIKEKWNQICGI